VDARWAERERLGRWRRVCHETYIIPAVHHYLFTHNHDPEGLSCQISRHWTCQSPRIIIHRRLAAEYLELTSLCNLTVRAPVPDNVILTPESVLLLGAFLEYHGEKLRRLDIRNTPRVIARTHNLALGRSGHH
jgi:hypothetical protein